MRHRHTLSHYKLLTGDMGQLLPIGLVEALPGDTFQHTASVFMRLSPMAAPVMHPVSLRIHHFFIPHRLTWPTEGPLGARTGWEAFITGGENNDDSQTLPTLPTTGTANDLHDYLGLPRKQGIPVSALPVRAFNMVFNEFYRDQDLVTARLEDDLSIPLVAWEKDYYTSARPWTQKGPAITLPIGDRAPVRGIGKDTQVYPSAAQDIYETDGTGTVTYANGIKAGTATGEDHNISMEEDPENLGFPNVWADLSAAEGLEINEFRRAFALQRYAEARARYGSRYTEYLRYLGVNPRDARLQRPEYLGGGRARVAMSEVLQTSDTQGGEAERFGVGDMYGHGVSSTRSNRYRRSFQEHGYVLSLMSVRPKTMYLDGVARTWLRRTKEDFWQKELEQIGQQEIWQGEVFSEDTPVDTYDTFGYADRYRDYKEEKSRVGAEFRDVLNYWHLGREFQTAPVLNASFVECDPSKRIYNVQTQHGLWIAVQHNLVARRLVRTGNSSRIL